MLTFILYGLIVAHITTYRNYYTKIGITFGVTYMMKRLIRSGGNKDHADLIGLAGYSLTICEFVKLLGAMRTSGFHGGNKEQINEIVGGAVGKGLDMVKDYLLNKGN